MNMHRIKRQYFCRPQTPFGDDWTGKNTGLKNRFEVKKPVKTGLEFWTGSQLYKTQTSTGNLLEIWWWGKMRQKKCCNICAFHRYSRLVPTRVQTVQYVLFVLPCSRSVFHHLALPRFVWNRTLTENGGTHTSVRQTPTSARWAWNEIERSLAVLISIGLVFVFS